jgi:hypothetical protein
VFTQCMMGSDDGATNQAQALGGLRYRSH